MPLSVIFASIIMTGSGPATAASEAAEPGKTYTITIEQVVKRPFVGRLGEARIGTTAVQIKRADLGAHYEVDVTAVLRNRFTGKMQAACRYRRLADGATGTCNMPPGS